MSTKTYTVRVPTDAPDTTSDHVSQWLESHLASSTDLAPDPGAGERSLRLSLDKEKVAQGARSADEPEATFLRRLVATNVPMSQEEKEESKTQARPRAPVLKGTLKLRPDQIRPVVRGFEAAQSYAIRQAFHVPEAVEAAAFTKQERDELSVATSEVLNRRAPQVLVENIDLVGLATTVIAIEGRKIEQVQAVAEYLRQQRARQASQPPEVRQGQVEGIS
jgi:hypothetical protein